MKGVIDTRAVAGFRLPGVVGLPKRLAFILLGKVNKRGGAADRRGTASRQKVITGCGTAGKVIQMRVGINAARYHHAAIGIDDVGFRIGNVASDLGNDAVDNQYIGARLVHGGHNAALLLKSWLGYARRETIDVALLQLHALIRERPCLRLDLRHRLEFLAARRGSLHHKRFSL